jgi:hypothetical protein
MVLHGMCITSVDTCRLTIFLTYFSQYLQVLQEKLLISTPLFQLILIISTQSDFQTYYILIMMVFPQEEGKLVCLCMLQKQTKFISFLLKTIYNYIQMLCLQELYTNFIQSLPTQQTLQEQNK